jgi:hypothetical protein
MQAKLWAERAMLLRNKEVSSGKVCREPMTMSGSPVTAGVLAGEEGEQTTNHLLYESGVRKLA